MAQGVRFCTPTAWCDRGSLAGESATREFSLHADGAVGRVGIVILILPLKLKARFIYGVIVDHDRGRSFAPYGQCSTHV